MNATRQCPKCGNAVSDLLRIEPGLRLRLQEAAPDEVVPDEVCGSCFKTISAKVSRGAKLRAEANQREQNKLIMWKSRVNFVKQGRSLMGRKAYSEAAVAFEKYLRVLEVVYDKKSGELTPDLFKDSARTKEITVVASVLWDLIRIYDTTPRYGERMKRTTDKLVEFLKFSTIQGEIIRKARQFEGQAKNTKVIKDFIKKADKKGGGCFIATAVFDSPEAPEVQVLRSFRDSILLKSLAGQAFVQAYYFTSPPIANVIRTSPGLKKLLKPLLGSFALWLGRKMPLQTRPPL